MSSGFTEFEPLLDFDVAEVLLLLVLTPPVGSPWSPVLRCVWPYRFGAEHQLKLRCHAHL